jgi:UPF0148 protein
MSEPIKKMAELLRSGATMLQETCPKCNSPLFMLGDKILCAKCGVRPSDATNALPQPDKAVGILSKLNSTALKRIEDLETEISRTTDLGKLSELAKLLLILLRIYRLSDRLGKTNERRLSR